MNKVLSIPRLPLIIASVLLAAGFWFIPAIPQDLHYHNFSDQRNILSVPNFFNVLSNLPYLLIGLYASGKLLRAADLTIIQALKPVYCGITDKAVTSLAQELGPGTTITVAEVQARLLPHLLELLGGTESASAAPAPVLTPNP